VRGRGTLLLVAGLLLAAGWLYYDVTGGQPGASWRTIFEEPAPPLPAGDLKRLFSFNASDVTAIRVQRAGRTLELRRGADGWSGVPRQSDADDFLAGVAELAEIIPIDATADGLAALGLAPPQGSIELTRRDAPPLLLQIGDRNPPATGVYARVGSDGPVVLTGALLLWNIDKLERAMQQAPAAPPTARLSAADR
jgi:hypothetical protein